MSPQTGVAVAGKGETEVALAGRGETLGMKRKTLLPVCDLMLPLRMKINVHATPIVDYLAGLIIGSVSIVFRTAESTLKTDVRGTLRRSNTERLSTAVFKEKCFQ